MLGKGGGGTVYQARQKSTGQVVAVKLLHQDGAADDLRRRRLIARFGRETHLCAQLHHPHIVRLLDQGQSDDHQLFAVFEYVPGETLKDFLLRRGALSALESGDLMAQILDALVCAHGLGIAHRDLKPHNIMVMATGSRHHVKVLDFGIAAFIPGILHIDRSLTVTQEAWGTPSYSAPEQLRGEPPTTRTDLYAWGLLFIECLTGTPAIRGATLAEIFHKQLSPVEVPLPPALLGHPLATLLRRVLQKNPGDRAAHAAALYADFQQLNLSNIVGNLAQQSVAQTGLEALTLTQEFNPGWLARPYERQQITVLCCSLSVNVTVGELEQEVLEALQRDQLSLCTDTGLRYGGYLAGSLGDSLMFYFGYPGSTDNDARRAARTALELVGQVHRRSRLLELQQGIRVGICIGMHSGIVLARPGSLPTGLTPNTALRLKRLANPGTALVSASARQLLRPHVEFEETGLTVSSYDNRAMASFLLIGEHDAEALSFLDAGNGAGRPLIGRSQQLQTLRAAWNQAKSGHGRSVLISGEAGIGKSRLRYELCAVARQENVLLRECRCLPEHKHDALYPLMQMLRTHLQLNRNLDSALAASRLGALLRQCACETEWALAILCSWLELPVPDGLALNQLAPDRQKRILLDTLCSLLLKLGNGTPVLLVIEDIHWMDQTSLALLDQLLRALPKHAFLLLLTARPGLAWGGGGQFLETLTLASLRPPESRQLIVSMLDGKGIEEGALSMLADRIDGIPLFAQELVRMLLDSQLLVESKGSFRLDTAFDLALVPATLRSSLAERLGNTGTARETAQLAATIGREFSHDLLMDVSLRDEASLQTDLEQLIAAELIYRRRRVHGDSYIFRHALVRDAAYDAMPIHFREQTHSRIAHALRSQPTGILDRNLTQLARHYSLAADFTNAIEYGIRAAQHALAHSLLDDTIWQAEQVLAWVAKLDLPDQVESALQINTILTLALMSKYGWADQRVRKQAEYALELLQSLCDSRHAPPTLWALATYHLVASHRDAERRLSDQLIALSASEQHVNIAAAASALRGISRWIDGSYREAEQAFETALQQYDPDRDAGHGAIFGLDSRIWALAGLAQVRWFSDTRDARAFDCAREAVAAAEKLNHIPSQGIALMYLALIHQYAGDCDGAREVCARLLALAQKYGLPAVEGYASIIHSWAISNLSSADDMLASLRHMGCMLGLTYYTSLPADIEARSGNFAHAIRRIDCCIALCYELGEHYYRAELHRRRAHYLAQQNLAAHRTAIKRDLSLAIFHARCSGMKRTEIFARKELTKQFGIDETDDEVCGRSAVDHCT